MLSPPLVPYLYIVPAIAMIVGTMLYVFVFGESIPLYAFITLAVLILYPLWVWWMGALPSSLMSTEGAVLVIAGFALAVIGAAVAATIDGTW